jgi:hypothetical protein
MLNLSYWIFELDNISVVTQFQFDFFLLISNSKTFKESIVDPKANHLQSIKGFNFQAVNFIKKFN